ncbi:HAMP domain-containing sensor histidine kinase [Metabacillus sp. RGM 3146]|uniref:HAMP domain-containing sensor histidine kinase n=1 Tax=Metabacillus sp. RGM 3146 TaxID=3401092 RepID=UPI003B99CD47
MKITTKINLLTTTWLLIILLIVNTVVYFSFIEMTVNMEKETLSQRSDTILKKVERNDTRTYERSFLDSYLTEHSFIRIVNSDSKLIEQVTNDKKLSIIESKYTTKKETELRKIHEKNGEEQILIIRIPVKSVDSKTATLEIGERLTGLEMRKDVLKSILLVCSGLAIILSLLGGRWLSGLIIKPISKMIGTMEGIEQSGVMKPILFPNATNDELEKLAFTFNRMIARLEENSQRQKQFVSDASHELKTPLTVIKSYSNLLIRRGFQDRKMILEASQAIYSEATRIQKMTEYLLDLAVSEKETVLEMESVDLVLVLSSILNQMQHVFKREMVFHCREAAVMIGADELKLEQLIIIILDNAMKYSSEKIEIFLEKNEKSAFIRIKDYGIGIPKNEIGHIFERFYRVDKARNRETGSSGLGLSIAKNIIKLHKGKIEIKSTEGEGTEVEIILPIL